jgi:hypothetical protein
MLPPYVIVPVALKFLNTLIGVSGGTPSQLAEQFAFAGDSYQGMTSVVPEGTPK